MVEAESIGEAEKIANIELNKIAEWATDNNIKFNVEKSKVMLLTRRKRMEQKSIQFTWIIKPYLKYKNWNIWE